MKKSYIIIPLLTFVLFLIKTKIGYGQLSADSIKYIIEKEVSNKRSASIIVGIIDSSGRQVISAGKVSDCNTQLPDGNTIYEIGSITKIFTSLLLADMVIQKQLDLNDPISKFLPASVKTPRRNGKEITLLNLAIHTSGLPWIPDNFDPKNRENPNVDYTVDQLYAFLSNHTLTRDIGSKFEYSNVAVGLLGHILALKAGIDYETLVKRQICNALNMKSTVVTLTARLKSNSAMGHNEYGKTVSSWDLGAVDGAGGLRSTVNDLLTFAAAQLGFIHTALDSAMR